MRTFELLILFCCFLLLLSNAFGRVQIVTTASQLQDAIKSVKPGDVIQLKNGTYRGSFRAERSGSPNAMIVLSGNYRSIISNKEGNGLHLKKANYWLLKGFTVANSRKGIVLDKSSNNIVEKVTIENVDEEGIQIKDYSKDNVIKESLITMIGLKSMTHGEGITIGTDYNHWIQNQSDKSDRNMIVNNRIGPGFVNEGIILNEGTCCGLVGANEFIGYNMSHVNGYGCWVKIKGNNYKIEHNRGVSTVSEGFMVISSADKKISACGNVFEHNLCDLKSDGYCIKIDDQKCDNVVYSDNAFKDGRALTNVPVTIKTRYFKFSFIREEINFALILAFTFLPSIMILGLLFYFRPHPQCVISFLVNRFKVIGLLK